MQRHFEVALYLLILTGFGTLASTGGLGIPTIVMVGVALLFRGYLLIKRNRWLVSVQWTSALTIGYMVFYAADYFLFSHGFLYATVHLVLFVMVLRSFSAHRDRDYYFLSAIAFLMVLSAALLTVDSIFLLGFAGFMLTAVVAFILMEMRYVSTKAPTHFHPYSNGAQRNSELTSGSMATSLAIASPVLVICILSGCGRHLLSVTSRLCRISERLRAGWRNFNWLQRSCGTGTHRRDSAIKLRGHAYSDRRR